MGEDKPSDDRILVNVVARSRPEAQLLEKRDGPNGLDDPRKFTRWGMDPARRRERAAGPLTTGFAVVGLGAVSMPETPGGRNGLVEGVGREVLET